MPLNLTADDLIAHARANGFDVSHRLLKRWWNDDLLPHPIRRGQGRGAGVGAFFSPNAQRQLDALLRFRRDGKSPLKLRFRLWLNGFAVPWERVRADLCELTGGPGAMFPPLSERVDELAAAMRRSRRLPMHRRGISADDTELLASSLISAMETGNFGVSMTDPVDDAPTGYQSGASTVGELYERLIGLDRTPREPWQPTLPGAPLTVAEAHGGVSFAVSHDALCTATRSEAEFVRRMLLVARESEAVRPWVDGAWREPWALAGMIGPGVVALRNEELMEALSKT